MSIIIKNNKKFIIDRTLPEIMKRLEKVDEIDLEKFLMLLEKVGVDLIEVNKFTLDKIKVLPEKLHYIYRVDDISHIYFLDNYICNFKYVILDYKKIFSLNNDNSDKLKGRKIILEVDIKILDKLIGDSDNKLFSKLNIDFVRIKNVVKYDLSGWGKMIQQIKDRFSANVGFCADDKFYMATAISIEALNDDTDFVTAAFNGEIYGLASLEEVLLGIKVVKQAIVSGDLSYIQELTKIYTQLTSQKIYCMKPVIGEDIFKCESGIHVDGIEKNTHTYEPYNPDDIGSKRTIYIGKHSGKKAVVLRLNSLNIDCNELDINKFLNKVRETSIRLKRNILDKELVQIYNDFKDTCLR